MNCLKKHKVNTTLLEWNPAGAEARLVRYRVIFFKHLSFWVTLDQSAESDLPSLEPRKRPTWIVKLLPKVS